MKLSEALARLRSAGVPDWFYATNGELGTGDCVGIEHIGGRWSVYYSERGSKSPLESFADEDSAARAFLRRVADAYRYSGRGTVPDI